MEQCKGLAYADSCSTFFKPEILWGFCAMQDVLRAAISLHQSGDLVQAKALYQKILASEPENAEALHLLGVLFHQQGAHARAVELISRAVAHKPNMPAFHANLAEAHRALGDYERAIGCCRAAIGLKPDYPEALANLGLALQAMGRRDEAAEQFRRRSSSGPGLPRPTITWATCFARPARRMRP